MTDTRVRGRAGVGMDCQLCKRPLRDHAVGEFCRRSDLPPSDGPRDPAPMTFTTKKEFQIMTSTGTWVEKAAKDLGIKGERKCRTCGGTGTITKKPAKADIGRTLFGHQSADNVLVRKLADPPLSRLQHVAEALGGVSLDDAATWCTQLSKRIEAGG